MGINTGLCSPATLSWVCGEVGTGTVINAVGRLAGATSSTLYFIETERQQRVINLVLRCFTNADWLAEEPDLVRHEAASLVKVKQAGIPAPHFVASDCEGAHNNGVPAILMTALPECLPGPPGNYTGWTAHGMPFKPRSALIETLDAFLFSVMNRF